MKTLLEINPRPRSSTDIIQLKTLTEEVIYPFAEANPFATKIKHLIEDRLLAEAKRYLIQQLTNKQA